MHDFALFVDAYLRKVLNSRSVDPVSLLYSACDTAVSATTQDQITFYTDKAFTIEESSALFNQSYFRLYIESIILSKNSDHRYVLQIIHNPRIKDYSRAVEITIELTQDGVYQSHIRTIRGNDQDLWYFLIQLADFSVMAKFKHQSGIPV